jgi:fatty acid desaturase
MDIALKKEYGERTLSLKTMRTKTRRRHRNRSKVEIMYSLVVTASTIVLVLYVIGGWFSPMTVYAAYAVIITRIILAVLARVASSVRMR